MKGAEREANEQGDQLIHQEQEVKEKQAAKDAKSKKAAAENTEKAREAAAQQRKSKELTSEGEKTLAQKRREKAKPPADDAGDRQPPGDDDQPWEIYRYRPIGTVSPTLAHDSEDRWLRLNDLEPTLTLDLKRTKREWVCGMKVKVGEPVQFLQVDKRRVRDIRAEQIERIAGNKTSVFRAPHPCLLKEGHMLIRVSIPYNKNGALLLGSFPGMKTEKHVVKDIMQVPTLALNVDLKSLQ